MIGAACHFLISLWHNRAANAAVEFAILAPILLLLVAGTIDLGLGFQEKLKLQSALTSGMHHVMQTAGAETDVTKQAIELGLPTGQPATVSVTTACRCNPTANNCPTSCLPGTHRFTTGTVSMPYKTLFFSFDMTLEAHFEVYVGRVQ